MKSQIQRVRNWTVGAAIAVALCATSWAHAGVMAMPSHIKVTSYDDAFAITLKHDGKAIPAGDVSVMKVMVNDHDYDHMFDMSADGGSAKVMPTDKLEIGTYDLVFKTPHGNAVVKAEAPLSDLDGTIQDRAEDLGLSTAALRRMMRIPDTIDESIVITVDMPSVYYLGQKAKVQMNTDADHEYAWVVDGKTVQFGYGDHAFEYTFMDTGHYFITYLEFADGEIIAQASDAVVVVPEPAVYHEARKNQTIELSAPDGYARYAWHVDDRFVQDGDSLSKAFAEPGAHVVECYAHTEAIGSRDDFRKVTYVINVQ